MCVCVVSCVFSCSSAAVCLQERGSSAVGRCPGRACRMNASQRSAVTRSDATETNTDPSPLHTLKHTNTHNEHQSQTLPVKTSTSSCFDDVYLDIIWFSSIKNSGIVYTTPTSTKNTTPWFGYSFTKQLDLGGLILCNFFALKPRLLAL